MNIWVLLGVFVIFDLFLLTFVVVSRSGKSFSEAEKLKYARVWEGISRMGDRRHAIMEADKLLYELLEKRGYRGTLGDKLKKAGPAFSNLNEVWGAHKLRNRLAHEMGAGLDDREAETALGNFKRAYRDLGLKL